MKAGKNLVVQQRRLWHLLLLHLLLLVLTSTSLEASKGSPSSSSSTATPASREPSTPPQSNETPKPKPRTREASADNTENAILTTGPVADAQRSETNGAGAVPAAATSVAAAVAPAQAAAVAPQAAASVATAETAGNVGATAVDKTAKPSLAVHRVSGTKEEWQDADDEQERQPLPRSGSPLPQGPPGAIARPRPLSAPFIRHYSKHMAILWEWYTKTIGATMNGKRKRDEDALVVHAPAHWQQNVRFKAVFDGHGGPAVSRTCVAQFCNYFGNMPDLSPETFKRTSLLLDAVIRADPVRHERGGSTGLVVAIERPDEQIPKFKVHVSNIGDSRAFILHRNGTYTIMSKDHKPSDPEEVARISRAGGFVSRVRRVFRVDGTLSLSRAFGDIRMKVNPLLPITEQKVVAVPDVRTFEASEGDYIFMACDGMFEAPGMSWDFVANLLQQELQNTKDNLVETAFRMLNTAYLLGSADNISIVLTKLMNRKRSSSVVKRFTYDFSGKREFVETQLLTSPNEYRSGTYHTPGGPVVTLF